MCAGVFAGFALATSTAAYADYNDGVEAYAAGDYSAAIAEWQGLAEAGDPDSQFGLGLIFESGRGVGRDYRAAAQWYRAAADQGHPGAQFNLGHLYRLGAGVDPDMSEAVRWWRDAADQGLAQAQVLLGLAYQRGDGVEADPALAVDWFMRAAEKNNPMGQYALGYAYESGAGVATDLNLARSYYELAAAAGFEQAIIRLTALTFPPTPEEPPTPPTEQDVLERPTSGGTEGQETETTGGDESTGTVQEGPVFIQIAAYVDRGRAQNEWLNMVARHPDLLDGLPHRVSVAQRDDGEPVFRLQAGPLPAASEAQAICSLLKTQQTDCFLVRD
ncbi:MAG: SPOR domain-containing protein [Alphaproteobacteria bacterium]|nr:hypothetical protein [Rhodospirillaceae bacterium]MDG2482047.1 SPOR domain-containing protein [Alphaproteobacteria bacterium]MBT6203530.1 hypothetical protein [Rhodospirillaceae bacterium]MBT6512722.1 hypothetical protein [Rhodospirillaceae bacterium]MBT7615276.1 hypothetical protein [Rhodospirillaceae bacterium]